MNRLLLFLLLILSSCSYNSKIIEIKGDLYFGFLRIGNYYNQPDSLIDKYENFIHSINPDSAKKDELKLYHQYKTLQKHDLLYQPFV